MSDIEERLAQSVSHLRRYALLTSTTKESAEDNLRATLHFVLRNQTISTDAIKVAMFATYHALWTSLNLLKPQAPNGNVAPAASDELTHAVLSVDLEDRQALILLAMEDFSESEAAYILDCPANDVALRNTRAKAAIANYLNAHAI